MGDNMRQRMYGSKNDWVTLLYSRNWHNIVNQLYLKKIIWRMATSHSGLWAPQDWCSDFFTFVPTESITILHRMCSLGVWWVNKESWQREWETYWGDPQGPAKCGAQRGAMEQDGRDHEVNGMQLVGFSGGGPWAWLGDPCLAEMWWTWEHRAARDSKEGTRVWDILVQFFFFFYHICSIRKFLGQDWNHATGAAWATAVTMPDP